jgi:hypothetical protein
MLWRLLVKLGDLVRIVWTVGSTTAPPVIGIVTKMRDPIERWTDDRQRVEIFCNGKLSWFEHGDLEVLAA